MSIKINYKNSDLKKPSNNLVLFSDDKFSLKPLKKYITDQEFSYISDLLKTSDLSKNLFVFAFSWITSKCDIGFVLISSQSRRC